MSILYTWSNFRQKRHTNGQNSAKQAHKIWRKNFRRYTVRIIMSRVLVGLGSSKGSRKY